MVVLAENFHLTGPQYKLLRKGLSFIPTLDLDKNKRGRFQWDLQQYHRRIKLATYYKNSKNIVKLPFTGLSSWSPSLLELPIEISLLIQEDWDTFKKHIWHVQERYNISIEEVKALRDLKKAKHIVIKPADKGSAVVVQSREQYIMEAERQLNDPVYYRTLEKPIFMDTVPMVRRILDTLKNKKYINERQRKYLIGTSEPRERRFYTLPKIHKPPEKWTIPYKVPPGRPIVSDCGSETYFTAEYLDFYLNPLSVLHPAYVRDTNHFIEIVKTIRIVGDYYFFSMDVDNLYTNIPIQAGIDCVRQIFEDNPDPKRPDVELLKLLEINLLRNDFMFNDKYYLQVKGTAMGKKFAPAYANIFMANWEREVFKKCVKKPEYYLRYLDDIWGIWAGSEEEFWNFVNILNCHDPSIKLKTEFHKQSIDFLDTTVFKSPNFEEDAKIDIKVFFKSTDTHALLHKKSFHPRHTFEGIVKSQLLRFQRICTRRENFLEAVKTLFKALRERGYVRSFLRHCFKTFQDRKEKDQGNLIPLITTFSTTGKSFNGKLKNQFLNWVQKWGMLPNKRVVSAYRKNKNLQDLLVYAKLPSLTKDKPLMWEKQFIRLSFIRNEKDRTIFQVQQGFSPRSKNCIYVIICVKCNLKYVGETKNTLSVRMAQHKYCITNQKRIELPVVRHFLKHGLDAIRIAGLEKNRCWTDVERKRKEKDWISNLSTREPTGLNVKINPNS